MNKCFNCGHEYEPVVGDFGCPECTSKDVEPTASTAEILARVESGAPTVSDGTTASYYELPEGATELQDLIAYRDMNGQLAEIQRAVYRYGLVEHSPKVRDIKKIIFYAQAELDRLEKYEGVA